MIHQERPYKDLSEWVPLETAVNYAAIDDYDDAGVLRKRFFNWAIRGYRRLRLNLLRTTKKYYLPVSSLGTAKIPPEMKKVGTVAYYDSCGDFVPIQKVGLIENVPAKTKCNCEKCSSVHTLCDLVEYERIEEPVNFNGTDYVNVITRSIDRKCGIYKEHREEYIWNAALNQVSFQESDQNLCDIELEPCGCVKDTPENIRNLSCCCCNMTQYFAANDPYWRHSANCHEEGFAVDYENGLIYVPGLQGIKKIYVEGYIDLPIINGAVYIPAVSVETIAAWILYKRDCRRNIAQVQKAESYENYKRELSAMRKAMIPLKASLIHNALNLVPRG